MNENPMYSPQFTVPNPLPRFRTLSMGVKLVVISGLALMLSIPALFVDHLVDERTSRAASVVQEVSSHVGGPQTFLGPTLAVPYTVAPSTPAGLPTRGVYLVFATQGQANVKLTTEERRRSLFKVPIFHSEARFEASFDLTGVPARAPANAQFDWKQAEVLVAVSDLRGASADATVDIGGKTVALAATQLSQDVSVAATPDNQGKLTFLGAAISGLSPEVPNKQFHVASLLRFSGAQRIAVVPFAQTTHISLAGDWPSPGFDGAFLPATPAVAPAGFHAEWTVPLIARGIRAEGPDTTITGLGASAVGMSLIEVADPYQSVTRSLKYIPLFLGLVFLSYFVFEVTTGKRVHVAQYLLVGLAQIIFYLLLLSLSERMGFDLGFLFAGGATVVLLSINAGWIFASRLQAVRALAIFSLLYTLIYMLLRLEDNALLVGASASFLAVAAAMYFTRRIDWYSPFTRGQASSEQGSPVIPQNPA